MTPPERFFDKTVPLERHEFFKGLDHKIITQLAVRARQVDYAAGQRIFSKGDAGYGLLAVVSGTVKISVLSEDGREVVLNHVGGNEIFGEIALLDGKPRTADATAVTPCVLLALDRRDFISVLASEPSLAVKLLEVVSSRLRRTSRQVEELRFAEPPIRLARALLRLGEMQGAMSSRRPRVAITQKELGQTIGLSRETTNRYLQEWVGAGYIELEKGGCVIKDLSGLMRHSEGTAD